MATGVKIGTVWDRTTEVLSGRSGAIATVAFVTLVLPTVVASAIGLVAPQPVLLRLLGSIVNVMSALLAIGGALAILALATHPSTGPAAAYRQAKERLLPAIGVSLVLAAIVLLLLVPIFVVLMATGFDFTAASAAATADTPTSMPVPAAGVSLFIVLYCAALFVVTIWAGARLMLVTVVVLNERLGLGAIRRSIELTRGMTWKLFGVLLLFGIVLGISTLAVQSVVGLVFRLILGGERIAIALFLAGIATTIVSAALTALAYVFTAQLYVATREKQITE